MIKHYSVITIYYCDDIVLALIFLFNIFYDGCKNLIKTSGLKIGKISKYIIPNLIQ